MPSAAQHPQRCRPHRRFEQDGEVDVVRDPTVVMVRRVAGDEQVADLERGLRAVEEGTDDVIALLDLSKYPYAGEALGDVRDLLNMIATGDLATEDASVNRPLSFCVHNNLCRVTQHSSPDRARAASRPQAAGFPRRRCRRRHARLGEQRASY